MTKYLLFQFILEHLVYAWQQPSHSQALTHRIYIYIKKSTNNRIFSLFLHFVTRIQLPTATQKWDSKLGNISLQSPLEWFMLFHAVFHRKSASKAPGVITLTRSTAHKLVWQRKPSIWEKHFSALVPWEGRRLSIWFASDRNSVHHIMPTSTIDFTSIFQRNAASSI